MVDRDQKIEKDKNKNRVEKKYREKEIVPNKCGGKELKWT